MKKVISVKGIRYQKNEKFYELQNRLRKAIADNNTDEMRAVFKEAGDGTTVESAEAYFNKAKEKHNTKMVCISDTNHATNVSDKYRIAFDEDGWEYWVSQFPEIQDIIFTAWPGRERVEFEVEYDYPLDFDYNTVTYQEGLNLISGEDYVAYTMAGDVENLRKFHMDQDWITKTRFLHDMKPREWGEFLELYRNDDKLMKAHIESFRGRPDPVEPGYKIISEIR